MRFLLILLLLFPVSALAQEHALTVDLAEDHVDVTTGFDGAHLVLFGVRNADGEVAVVLKGPEAPVAVRQKQNVLGAWINRASVRFEDVPQFYDYALSVNDEEQYDLAVRKKEQIGIKGLDFEVKDEDVSAAQKKEFLAALNRTKREQGHFPSEAKPITFLSDSFFKTEFYLPSSLPTGAYVVETFLLKGERIIDKRVTNIKVAQTGFGAQVYKFAESYAFLYAVLVVVFAMFAGWLSNAVRRKR